jgi:hypothetical protein
LGCLFPKDKAGAPISVLAMHEIDQIMIRKSSKSSILKNTRLPYDKKGATKTKSIAEEGKKPAVHFAS